MKSKEEHKKLVKLSVYDALTEHTNAVNKMSIHRKEFVNVAQKVLEKLIDDGHFSKPVNHKKIKP